MNLPLFLIYKIIDYLDNYTKSKFIIAYKSSISYFDNIRELNIYISDFSYIYIINFYKNIETLSIYIDNDNYQYINQIFSLIFKQLNTLKIRITDNELRYTLLNKNIKKIIRNHIHISDLYIENCDSMSELTLQYIKNTYVHLRNIKIINCKCITFNN